MSRQVTTVEAAEILGITDSAVRQRIKAGTLKGRKRGNRIMVTVNGDEPVPELTKVADGTDDTRDPLEIMADELISLGKRFKRAIKYHDEQIRKNAITDFATTLAETVQKGR